jgi:hypothetical protein
MADDKTGDTPQTKDEAAEAETKYWDKLKAEVGGIVDEKLKAIRTDDKSDGTPNPGTSRTGARRVTLQTLISDLVYGPPKDQ